MQSRTLRLLTVLAAVLLLGAPTQAAPVVVPNALAAAEGNTNTNFPFNMALFEPPSLRYQQVYSASEFSPATQWITQIRFRPDAGVGTPFASVLPRVRIDLSTTGAAPDALSTTFADNVGADNQIVYGGETGAPLSLSSADVAGPGGTRAFDIVITLAAPFLYDPADGNLLLDVRNFEGGASTHFDVNVVIGDAVSRVTGGVNSEGGAFDTTGLVTEFEAIPADSDGDGVLDDVDECPNSDLSLKVDTGSGPTSVSNIVGADGCSIQDLVNHAADDAGTHGAYVSAIAQLAGRLKAGGIISAKQQGELTSGAAKSNIGK